MPANAIKHFIKRVKQEARRKPENVRFGVFGKERIFYGYDWGGDTFIFEKDVLKDFDNHAAILIVKKSDILRGSHGYILTLTTGNHSVALIPLVSGEFWSLGSINERRRHKTVSHFILCANAVKGKIEISQREVDYSRVIDADDWLQSLGFRMDEIVFADRNSNTLEIYRRLGQEWRVKPLAWTKKEMRAAINHSRTAINSKLRYFHSSTGVHFLSYTGFLDLIKLFENDYGEFIVALKELIFVYTGQHKSNMRSVKINNHHEIELFGPRVGTAETFIISELERLMDLILHKKLNAKGISIMLHEICYAFKQSLESPNLADENSSDFIETIYIHLSGEIYHINTNGVSAAFDARRIALPGATFRGNRPDFHPVVDSRTKVLIYNVEQILSNSERMEYVNVYELRDEKSSAVGDSDTREIVFKTNRSPLCTSLIEKRLALHKSGYGSYLLARVQAFKSLGMNIGDYRLLTRLNSKGVRRINYFLRNRCPGEPLDTIKNRLFSATGVKNTGKEKKGDIVTSIAALLGDAAAQNLVMKKYNTASNSCYFGEGKEIFDTGYNVKTGTEMPVSVMTCSIRGAFGWMDISFTEENISKVFDFYLTNFASVLYHYWKEHQGSTSLSECIMSFITGFESKTKEMYWNYMVNRDAFDSFNPRLNKSYAFVKKWQFVLWSLEQQHSKLDELHKQFVSNIVHLEQTNAAKPQPN